VGPNPFDQDEGDAVLPPKPGSELEQTLTFTFGPLILALFALFPFTFVMLAMELKPRKGKRCKA
jgi:hypothetical protein